MQTEHGAPSTVVSSACCCSTLTIVNMYKRSSRSLVEHSLYDPRHRQQAKGHPRAPSLAHRAFKHTPRESSRRDRRVAFAFSESVGGRLAGVKCNLRSWRNFNVQECRSSVAMLKTRFRFKKIMTADARTSVRCVVTQRRKAMTIDLPWNSPF